MSYILDALKKSDQMRKRGAAPTLQSASVVSVQPPRSRGVYFGLSGAILMCGIAIGWLRPWQATVESPLMPAAITAPTAVQQSGRDAVSQPLQQWRTAEADTAKPETRVKPEVRGGGSPADSSDGDEKEVVAMEELPPSIQAEIPALAIQMHAYSKIPRQRLVSINSKILREGEFLAPGLILVRITPEGMILGYKGYRFQRARE